MNSLLVFPPELHWLWSATWQAAVLDAKGTIRFKDVRGKRFDEAVDALLAELD